MSTRLMGPTEDWSVEGFQDPNGRPALYVVRDPLHNLTKLGCGLSGTAYRSRCLSCWTINITGGDPPYQPFGSWLNDRGIGALLRRNLPIGDCRI